MSRSEVRVLFSTSDRVECGVAEHGAMLMEALPDVQFVVRGPDPPAAADGADIVHCNWHAALSSRWTPKHVQALQGQGTKVVMTLHDTFETFSLMQGRGFQDFRCADALVVHEPVEGLDGSNVHYIRQGVPLGPTDFRLIGKHALYRERPVVGTVGFPFPWKNYDLLCTLARQARWRVLLIAPGATVEQCRKWQELNPMTEVISRFLPRQEVVNYLGSCTATAFLYSTGNSGTTAALRLGIAARKPVIAFHSRQTRDLDDDSRILWCADEGSVGAALDVLGQNPDRYRGLPHLYQMMSNGARSLAEQDSWTNVAAKYAAIYRTLVGGKA